jgi:DNA helicase-4
MFRKIRKIIQRISGRNKWIEISERKLVTPIKKTIKKKVKKKSISEDPLTFEKQEIAKYSAFLSDFGDNFEQKRAVVSKSKRILVLAGAGSGKTKVLTKRFIHLVKNKEVYRDNILALTFTKEAANEMLDRISKSLDIDSFHLKRNVRTFHSFCLGILKQDEQFDVLSEKDQEDLIKKIVVSFKNDEQVMQSLYNYIKDNVLEKILVQDSNNAREPRIKDKPEDFGSRRIQTIGDVYVRSKSERDIANFLSALGVKWEYETPTDWADKTFKPDFTIEGSIYLEHWCYDDNSPEFSNINKKTYLAHRKWKEAQYQKHSKTLVSIEEREMLDLQKLQMRLKNELEELLQKRLETQSILELLKLSKDYEKAYNKAVDEILEIINLAKSLLFDVNDVKKLVHRKTKQKVIDFYNVLIPVMDDYEKLLEKTDYSKKDFNDLIKDAVFLLKNKPNRAEYYRNKIRYILLDEYQDVSYGEVELLKLLVDKNTNLFAVGDDWQSIYGWRGSDVKYILNFAEDFGKCEKITLQINYRSTKNIVEASTEFMKCTKNKYDKDIKSCDTNCENLKIIQVNADNDFGAARFIVYSMHKIMSEDKTVKESDFLVLTRSSRISKLYSNKLKEIAPRVKIRTIHWSKGKEYDYVFVLGLKGGTYGFPNVYADKDIKQLLIDIPIENKEEEERRLFYVAMTRAKKQLFLISEFNNESEFAKQVPMEYKYLINPRQQERIQ